jgi:hypothetical protein
MLTHDEAEGTKVNLIIRGPKTKKIGSTMVILILTVTTVMTVKNLL